MPIYFSSEDGKYYDYDIGLTSTYQKDRIGMASDYSSKILSDIDYNDNAVDKYDKVAVFKNTIENYFNRTLKYLNFSGMDEVDTIVSSGMSTVNGATFAKYYEASYLSNWKKDIDTLVADATNKFVDGVTGLPDPNLFIRKDLFPREIYFEGITGSYYRNFFDDKNYNVFNYYGGGQGQLSPLVIEEVVKGISASLTGIGPIDGECLSGGNVTDPIPVITSKKTYKFPTVHMWGFEPSDKIFNFMDNPSKQNMLEAFFGAGEDGIFAYAHQVAGQTFGGTAQGMYGLPCPAISLTGGVVGQNGETGSAFASTFIEGLTQGNHIFNMNILPDGLSSENIEEFTKLMNPLDYRELQRELGITQEEFDKWWKKFCAKIGDNPNDKRFPIYVPGFGNPTFDEIYPPGYTGTFGDLFDQFVDDGFNAGEVLTPLAPLLLSSTGASESEIESLFNNLKNLGILTVNELNSSCENSRIACENVNWYDPDTNPCGYAFLKQCCDRKLETNINVKFEMSEGIFRTAASKICKMPELDEGVPLEVVDNLRDQYLNTICDNCEPPNRYDPTTSPCYDASRVRQECVVPRVDAYLIDKSVTFDHTFKIHFSGECILLILRRLSKECRKSITDQLPLGFPLGVIGSATGTLIINIKITYYSRFSRQFILAAGECGCLDCPCERSACSGVEPCENGIRPDLVLPP